MVDSAAATSVVLLTPSGRAAIASLLVSGPAAVACVSALFRPAAIDSLAAAGVGRIVFGRWQATGEELVACRVAADEIELHCHGGPLAAAEISRSLCQLGCRALSWQAWLPLDESDPLKAAALAALADATTERTAGILLDQYHGALGRALEELLELCDREDPASAAAAERLRRRAPLGLHLTAPWQVVLAGQPNVGKSSLLNALLGYERAIVFDRPGTTRDVLRAGTALAGWPVELSDTAGLREAASDAIEASGVARARGRADSADVVALVLDASRPWDDADAALLTRWPDALLVLNKCDLLADASSRSTQGGPASPVAAVADRDLLQVSALTGLGIEQLAAAIARRLVPEVPPPGTAVPFTQAQVDTLDAAADLLAQQNFSAAAARLRAAAR